MLHRKLAKNFLKPQNINQLRRVSAIFRGQHTAHEDESDAEEFRELVHDFAQRVIAPHAADIDRENSFPRKINIWTELGQMGLHGAPDALLTVILALWYQLSIVSVGSQSGTH